MTAPAGWYPDPSGKPGQRYFDGRVWTEHYGARGSTSPQPMLPSYGLPQRQMGVRGSLHPLPVRRPQRQLLVIALIVAAVVAGVVVMVATGRDGPSYQAGRSYGTRVLSKQLNESAIRVNCATGAALAHDRDGYYYWPGGQIKGSEVNEDDFAHGCIDALK